MASERSSEPGGAETDQVWILDTWESLQETARRTWQDVHEKSDAPPFYRIALGREPIQVGVVESRILLYLASRPYHPFNKSDIAQAVSTGRYPVTEETVDDYIASLRDQLGVFHDYVQSVPYLGYRFKA